MIRHKRKGVAGGLCLRKDRCTSVKEIPAVIVVEKYPSSLNAADDDVMKDACRIKSGLSGHGSKIAWKSGRCQELVI
jgi:hypothetical protein